MQKRSAARRAPARRSLLLDLSLTRRRVREGGFLSPRVAIVLPLCAAACSLITGTLLGFLQSEATPKTSQRTLTFQERVAYQRAIEDVYWRHRIWPRNGGQRPDPKPSLDSVMSHAQTEKTVRDYLGMSQ